jgi:hypothetical protein
MQLHFLQIKIFSEMPLLTPYLRKKLNPLQITIVACKDIPYKTEPKYKPIYAECQFVDGKSFST